MEVSFEEEGARERRAGVDLNSKMEQIVLEGVVVNKVILTATANTNGNGGSESDVLMGVDKKGEPPQEDDVFLSSDTIMQKSEKDTKTEEVMYLEDCNLVRNKTEESASQNTVSESSSSSISVFSMTDSDSTASFVSPTPTPLKSFCTPVSAVLNHICKNNTNLSLISSSGKKSNLRKYSKYDQEANSDGTPKDPDPTPRKRIRIVENFETCMNSEMLAEDDFALVDRPEINDLLLDSGTKMYKTYLSDEEILWVSPAIRALDFAMINYNAISASRLVVPKKFNVELDMHFIDSETVNPLLGCKASIHQAGPYNYENLCNANSPFPNNRVDNPTAKDIFKYEANAMKLANIDAGLDFDLTFPKNLFGNLKPESSDSSVFYFGDIWVTSKGFREYILWKTHEYMDTKGLVCKGFALNTLNLNSSKSSNDFHEKCGVLFSSFKPKECINDQDLEPLPIELVEHFTLDDEVTAAGASTERELDLTDINVTDGFVKSILDGTDGQGVHLLVVDNPEYFSIHENVREVRFQRKLYCQCIVALLGVREGGSFVVKIFDSVTLFTVGLIFLMHRCFKSISIHKPKSSPNHSSERFLICKDKLKNDETDEITQVLLQCHTIVVKNEEVRRISRKKFRRKLEITKMEVKWIVPLRVIIGHAEFFEFMRLTNIRLTRNLAEGIENLCLEVDYQPQSLESKIKWRKMFAKEIRESVMKSLNIRKVLLPSVLTQKFNDAGGFILNLLKQNGCDTIDFSLLQESRLVRKNLEHISKTREVWRVFPLQDLKKTLVVHGISLFVGFGGEEIFYYENSQWKANRVEGLVLTKGTVVFGEITEEISYCGEASPKFSLTFHIIDAISLNGKFIGNLSFPQRQRLCRSYASALNRSLVTGNPTALRVRDPIVVTELSEFINMVAEKEIMGHKSSTRVCQFNPKDSNFFMALGGLLFWNVGVSTLNSLTERIVWKWDMDEMNKDDPNSHVALKDLLNLQL